MKSNIHSKTPDSSHQTLARKGQGRVRESTLHWAVELTHRRKRNVIFIQWIFSSETVSTVHDRKCDRFNVNSLLEVMMALEI